MFSVIGKNVVINSNKDSVIIRRRKIHSETEYKEWDGQGWIDIPTDSHFLNGSNFTDYNLDDGIYVYRFSDDGENWTQSQILKVGADKYGYTFGNYVVPDDTWGEILTPDDLRYTYLWGVDFKASNGDTFTDKQIKFTIDSALAEMERYLQYNFVKRVVKCNPGKDDVYDIESNGYSVRFNNQLLLDNVPVLSIERCIFVSPYDTKLLDMKDWIFLDKATGKIVFRPKHNALSSGALMPFHFGNWQLAAYQHAFKVDYTVGLENASKVPDDVRDIIGKIAAMKLLNTIGDGLIAGFSSSSLSMDGVSESFSSTQSATSAYFGARIKVYQDDVMQFKKEMKKKFGRPIIGCI